MMQSLHIIISSLILIVYSPITTSEENITHSETLLSTATSPSQQVTTISPDVSSSTSFYDEDYSDSTADYDDINMEPDNDTSSENNGTSNTTSYEDPEGFCSKTVSWPFITPCLPCELIDAIGCPAETTKVSKSECEPPGIFLNEGCLLMCMETHKVPDCCPGRWGPDCQPCPSIVTAHNDTLICGGRGQCSESIGGNGSCACDLDFGGTSCELCARTDAYGPFCNQTCTCVHGFCNAGIDGDGKCTCIKGFEGPKCDIQTHCLPSLCSEFAHCEDDSDNINCICDFGYEGDGKNCTLIDYCDSSRSKCSSNAICKMLGPGNFTCQCMEGHMGDGVICIAIDLCQDVKDPVCPFNSTQCKYTGPGKYTCECKAGFANYTEDAGCTMRNLCAENDKLCNRNADCSMLAPLIYNCECKSGYIGDGLSCYGNILQTLKDMNMYNSVFRNKLNRTIELYSYAMRDTLQSKRKITAFVPMDVFPPMMNSMMKNWYVASQTVKQHIIPNSFTIEKLRRAGTVYTLEGNSAQIALNRRRSIMLFKLPGYNYKARLVRVNIAASNGYIHLVRNMLQKPPVIGYKPKQPILAQIQSDGRYNRLESLIASAGLQELLNNTDSTRNLTFFASNNKAWDILPAGSVQYLQSKEGKAKLVALLKNHIVENVVHSYDLLNVSLIRTMENNALTVEVSARGRFLLNGNVTISQTDIPASNGIFHHVSGILIPESIKPLLPRYCNDIKEEPVRGLCGPCDETLHCPLPTDIPDTDVDPISCVFNDGNGNTQTPGCSRACKRRTTTTKCCQNFYGPNCAPCPGGHLNVCGGRGTCNDGITGSGTCDCHQNFTGSLCEFCTNPSKFGPHCNQDCQCLHGHCASHINSKGHCKLGSCFRGYTGKDCELSTKPCGPFRCHVNAECMANNLTALLGSVSVPAAFPTRKWFMFPSINRGRSLCVCKDGYNGNGMQCTAINPCEQEHRGDCHKEADCTYTGPGQNNCTCRIGWVGDGTYCYPSTPCRLHSHCHKDALCEPTVPGQYQCRCKENYHGNGTNCVPINMCEHSNGGCHRWAVCVSLGPGNRTCSCKPGYAGDGISCYGTLWEEMQARPELKLFTELARNSHLPALLSNISRHYTLFLPINSSIQSRSNASAINNLIYLRYHVIKGMYKTDQLKTLASQQGTSGHYFMETLARNGRSNLELNISILHDELLINSGRIKSENHFSLNGIIHIMTNDLTPLRSASNIGEVFSKHPSFSSFYNDLQGTGLAQNILTGRVPLYTIFAVENSVWKPQYTENMLKKYMSYYILPLKLSLENLKKMSQVATLMGHGPSSKLNISTIKNNVFINGHVVYDDRLSTPSGNVFKLTHMLNPNLHRCDDQLLDGSIQAQCCQGYYGFDCLECPGGSKTPCNNHGICDATITGFGHCTCSEGFAGQDCDSCAHGFVGPDCHLDMCTLCHTNAICQKHQGNVGCVCAPGYVGDGMKECNQACAVKNGGCDKQADCSVSFQTGKVSCTCKDGFHGNGTLCLKIDDLCKDGNGGCSKNAYCTFVKPKRDTFDSGSVTCNCKKNYAGNGTLCNGDMLSTLASMNVTQDFYHIVLGGMNHTSKYSADVRSVLKDRVQSKTLFVPVNWIEFNDTEREVLEIERHIVLEHIRLDESGYDTNSTIFLAMSGNNITITREPNTGRLMVNNTKVLVPNIPTSNGIIHLIENSLEASANPKSMAVRDSLSQEITPYIIGVLLVVTLLIILIALALARWRLKLPPFSRVSGLNNDINFKILGGFDNQLYSEDLNEEPSDASAVFKNPLYDRLVDSS